MFVDRNPLGYKNLRTWQQANEIFELTEKFVATLPARNPKTGQFMSDTSDHMLRSARSGVRNIEEGYSRTTTGEYISFLGFSKGSLEELLGDFQYCIKNNLGNQELAKRAEYLLEGEGKMLESQMRALKEKMVREKTFSNKDHDKLALDRQKKDKFEEEKFLKELREKFLEGKVKGYQG